MTPVTSYALVLFDMDGTLYYQRPLRIAMMQRLLFHGWSDIRTVLAFRRLREHWSDHKNGDKSQDLFDAQIRILADRTGDPESHIRSVVRRWIYEEPLELLPRYADQDVIDLIRMLQSRGVSTAIYSDYPVEDKQRVLGLSDVQGYSAEDPDIRTLKPDPEGIRVICARYDIGDPARVLMIGDRMEKDGEAARAAGARSLILPRDRIQRKRKIRQWKESGLWPQETAG